MVPGFEYLSKGALTDSLVDFKPVSDVVMDITYVFTLVIIEATVFWTIRSIKFTSLFFLQIYEIYLIVIKDFSFFIIEQEL